jgi:ABC-type uncharacterized transport system substrate-binding protein
MDRRAFIGTLAAGLLAAPIAAEAQQAGKVPRVGLLTGDSEAGSRTRFAVFREGLRELGYVDKQTIVLEYRYANDNYERLPGLAVELVRLDVSVIVANGPPASLAAKQATSTIPVVMFETADPVGSNIVSNLARPGGNITGVAQLVGTDVFGKQLEMLEEIVPKLPAWAYSSTPRTRSSGLC